jgi:hypothetical protein
MIWFLSRPLIRLSATFSLQAGRSGCRPFRSAFFLQSGSCNKPLVQSSPLPACGGKARVRGALYPEGSMRKGQSA